MMRRPMNITPRAVKARRKDIRAIDLASAR